MFLESITPKELQVYVVIGTFLISLLIDLIFYKKTRINRIVTLGNLWIVFWLIIIFLVGSNQTKWWYTEWDRFIPYEMQLFLIFAPPILYIYSQISIHRLVPENKFLEGQKESFNPYNTHSLIDNILLFGVFCLFFYAGATMDYLDGPAYKMFIFCLSPLVLALYVYFDQTKKKGPKSKRDTIFEFKNLGSILLIISIVVMLLIPAKSLIFPPTAEENVIQGNSLYNEGWYYRALERFDRAIEIDPDCTDAWNGKGMALYRLNKDFEALECFDKVIELDPDFVNAWIYKGKIFGKHDKLSEALECFDKAISIAPNYADAWSAKGYVLYDKGKYSEAIECFDQAIALKSNDKILWLTKGNILNSQGKHIEAIECYDKVIEMDPNYAGAWNNKGNALQSLGRDAEARECYDKVKELSKKQS